MDCFVIKTNPLNGHLSNMTSSRIFNHFTLLQWLKVIDTVTWFSMAVGFFSWPCQMLSQSFSSIWTVQFIHIYEYILIGDWIERPLFLCSRSTFAERVATQERVGCIYYPMKQWLFTFGLLVYTIALSYNIFLWLKVCIYYSVLDTHFIRAVFCIADTPFDGFNLCVSAARVWPSARTQAAGQRPARPSGAQLNHRTLHVLSQKLSRQDHLDC